MTCMNSPLWYWFIEKHSVSDIIFHQHGSMNKGLWLNISRPNTYQHCVIAHVAVFFITNLLMDSLHHDDLQSIKRYKCICHSHWGTEWVQNPSNCHKCHALSFRWVVHVTLTQDLVRLGGLGGITACALVQLVLCGGNAEVNGKDYPSFGSLLCKRHNKYSVNVLQ